MDDFDVEARTDMDLVKDTDQVVGFADDCRRQDADIFDIIVAKELAESQQDLTDFVQGLKLT